MYTCHNCGSDFDGHKRKFCKRTCSTRYQNRKAKGRDLSIFETAPPILTNVATMLKCLECFSVFKRTKNGGSDGRQYTKYCSMICGTTHRGAITRELTAIRQMGANVLANRSKRLNKVRADRVRLLSSAHEEAKYNHCSTCGDATEHTNKVLRSVSKCGPCKDAHYNSEEERDNRRAYRREGRRLGIVPPSSDRSRAKHYGVEYEHVNRIMLFGMYEWCCALCGIDTPREAKGTGSNDSPELDHIIPISKGGPHTYANVQLLCRACNATKSDVEPSQVRTHPLPPLESKTGHI